MTRTDPPARHPLPGSEVPSAEVLDELLRAFSVDMTDQQGMDRVDLASPEVAELLTPPADASPGAAAAPTIVSPSVGSDPEPQAQPEVEVEVEVEVAVDAEPSTGDHVDVGSDVEIEAGAEV
ncbi:MAG: hypothetical protein ABW122_02580, partial [Ilumatobacteraceae bacterium]